MSTCIPKINCIIRLKISIKNGYSPAKDKSSRERKGKKPSRKLRDKEISIRINI